MIKRPDGYIAIYNPNRKGTYKYDLQHRILMEKKLGRKLKKKEIVHHKNKIRDYNKLNNLELCENSAEHNKRHPQQIIPSRWTILTCNYCKKKFSRKKSNLKNTQKVWFCSRECYKKGIGKFHKKSLIVKCLKCKRKFERIPSNLKRRKKHFCSKKCYYEYGTRNF